MPDLVSPASCNYVAVFLTLRCNYTCSFCINHHGGRCMDYSLLPGVRWIEGLNRLQLRPDLPITLQGGEPTLHPDFYPIVRSIRGDLDMDMLTNLQFDVTEFMSRIPPERFRHDAPYASIRISYHPEVMDWSDTRTKTLILQNAGYPVGIWAVQHPAWQKAIAAARQESAEAGIDFRIKELLGCSAGRLSGTFAYPEALGGVMGNAVDCRTTEVIIGPDGSVFRCHADLYRGREAIGHICDPGFQIRDEYRACEYFGDCNPCDIKIKTNRFQEFGHTSVDIRLSEKEARLGHPTGRVD